MKSSLRGMKARQPPSSTTAFHRHSFGHIGASRRQRQFEARRPLVLPDPTLGRCGSESQHESPQVIMAAKQPDLRGESGSHGTRTRALPPRSASELGRKNLIGRSARRDLERRRGSRAEA